MFLLILKLIRFFNSTFDFRKHSKWLLSNLNLELLVFLDIGKILFTVFVFTFFAVFMFISSLFSCSSSSPSSSSSSFSCSPSFFLLSPLPTRKKKKNYGMTRSLVYCIRHHLSCGSPKTSPENKPNKLLYCSCIVICFTL